MRKFVKSLMLVAVAAMAFTACNADLVSVDLLKKSTTITFTASMNDDTRASINDEDGDNIFKVTWDEGDKVAFVVYDESNKVVEIQEATVETSGPSAEFTVNFASELTDGQRIVAYMGYDYYVDPNNQYSWIETTFINYSSQTPRNNNADKRRMYMSAEYQYDGNSNAKIKFSHDCAYAIMTIEGLSEVSNVNVVFNNYNRVSLYGDNVENNIFVFTHSALNVSNFLVEATTYNEGITETYSFSKNFEDGVFTLTNGKVAMFTIKDWKSILASPNVQATEITPNSITFSWEAVAGAEDYTYTVNGTTETTDKTSVVVTDLEPLTEYTITVVANPVNSETHATSKEGYAYATTGADRSVLDKEFTEVVEFANMTKLENYTNTYLFTTDGGGTTINDKFMYLKFNNEIDFSKSGEYSIDDLSSYSGECCIWVGREVDGCNGYFNYYKLGFLPYHFYPNPGDTYVIYVDVVDGKSSITVYANNPGYWSAIKFKGVYVVKEALATPVLTYEINGNAITVNWEAIEGAANYTVTCGNESKTIEGTTATFEGLEYSTAYTVTVVANPADPNANKPSEAATLNTTTGKDPISEAVTVETVATSVSGNGSNRYFTLYLTTESYSFKQLWFDTLVESNIIAEGTFNVYDATVSYLDENGNDSGWEFGVSGTITVAHDIENQQYNLTFNLNDENGSTFVVTYIGKINGIYSPGEATPLNSPSYINYEAVNFTDVVITWNAVEDAGSYELYYEYSDNSTNATIKSEPVTTTETTYTFSGLTPGIYYTIFVKALPSTSANTESEYARLYDVIVYPAPNTMETSYTFTTAQHMGNNKIRFSDANNNIADIQFDSTLTEISAGIYYEGYGPNYVSCWECKFNGSTMYPLNYVLVEGNPGETQTVTIVASTTYDGEVVKSVFTGVINMETPTLEYTSASIARDGNNLAYIFEGDGFGLNFNYYANGADGIAPGKYTFTAGTHYSSYYTYTLYDYKYMTSIDLTVTGAIGETQTYEFVLHTEYAGDIKAKYTGVLQAQ